MLKSTVLNLVCIFVKGSLEISERVLERSSYRLATASAVGIVLSAAKKQALARWVAEIMYIATESDESLGLRECWATGLLQYDTTCQTAV